MMHQAQTDRKELRQQHQPAAQKMATQSADNTHVCGACAAMPRYLSGSTLANDVNYGTVIESATQEDAQSEASANSATATAEPSANGEQIGDEELAISGEGREVHAVAFGMSMEGRTDAAYSSSYRTSRLRRRSAAGCDYCDDADCVHVTGTLISTFRVATTVTLPSVADFPDLTPCQQRRVRAAIRNVLAPHEQDHVRKFRTYRGRVSTPIDLTLCNADVDAEIETLHNDIEAPRQAAAQAASDALDPFNFEVDLDCEDS